MENCPKRRAWTVSRFKGGFGKKEGGVFEGRGVDTPMGTMISHHGCEKYSHLWCSDK